MGSAGDIGQASGVSDQAALSSLVDGYDGVSRFVRELSAADLLRPSRCLGWAVCDVLQHLLLDAQRALVAFATPHAGPSDRDFVTYWQAYAAEVDREAAQAHARFVRLVASAYHSPTAIGVRWEETAAAALRAAAGAPPDGFVSTQGHVLAVPDFLATLAVEAAVHHQDLTVDFPAAAGPSAAALDLVRRTLDGLLGQPLPLGWDSGAYALKGTGRVPLTDGEREALGGAVDRFPLLG